MTADKPKKVLRYYRGPDHKLSGYIYDDRIYDDGGQCYGEEFAALFDPSGDPDEIDAELALSLRIDELEKLLLMARNKLVKLRGEQ